MDIWPQSLYSDFLNKEINYNYEHSLKKKNYIYYQLKLRLNSYFDTMISIETLKVSYTNQLVVVNRQLSIWINTNYLQ